MKTMLPLALVFVCCLLPSLCDEVEAYHVKVKDHGEGNTTTHAPIDDGHTSEKTPHGDAGKEHPAKRCVSHVDCGADQCCAISKGKKRGHCITGDPERKRKCQDHVKKIVNFCNTTEDCSENECCVLFAEEVYSGQLNNTKHGDSQGRCKKIGQLGDVCSVNNKSNHVCPCDTNLICQSLGGEDANKGNCTQV